MTETQKIYYACLEGDEAMNAEELRSLEKEGLVEVYPGVSPEDYSLFWFEGRLVRAEKTFSDVLTDVGNVRNILF